MLEENGRDYKAGTWVKTFCIGLRSAGREGDNRQRGTQEIKEQLHSRRKGIEETAYRMGERSLSASTFDSGKFYGSYFKYTTTEENAETWLLMSSRCLQSSQDPEPQGSPARAVHSFTPQSL